MTLFFLFFLFFISESHAQQIKIIEQPSAVSQGQVLYVKFNLNVTALPSPSKDEEKDENEEKIKLNFLKKEIACYKKSDSWYYCLAAVPADAKIGKQKAEILYNDKPISKFKVKITATQFPIEPLTLSDEKKSLLTMSGREEEIKRIRSALSTETMNKFWGNKFIKPVEGTIESLYGEKRILDGKMRKGYHRGLDLGASEGTTILSTNSGKVVLAGSFIEEGNMVMVDHGQGIISAYFHQSEILVKEGQMVKSGEQIGKVGSTGVGNTPHLHWGIYIHGTPIDPLFWLKSSHLFE